ncbi:DNA polymerase III subunit delta [Pedobacter sp. SYSU D00535]|uniref:DNA polymerase III subunit delta n=1 Tax=Pedobacter sp. SYSU D00535 TaxID=2810308 RepID=UPI001A97CB7C|nr:DNA polymerase III subunit delta [Pedobacter sp. SYSU D00535]
MTAAALMADLKSRKFKPVYLFHGEEPYYVDLFSNYIESNLLSEAERGFNQTVVYGRDVDVISILNAAKRFPMMSDYQLVLVKEAQDLKWGKDSDDDKKAVDPLLAYLEKPVPSTILVFCYKHAKFDKRKKTYKAIEKNGVVFESATIYDNKVAGWVEDFVREKAYRVQPRAAALIAEYLGNDLSKIANELEKLMLNIPKGTEITAEHVQDNIGISKEYNVFELQDALAKRDPFKANQIIDYFSANPKSNPIQMVLGALNTWFTKILKCHYVSDKSAQNLAKELGVNPFFVKDYELAARNYNAGKTFDVISYLREYDLKTKGVDATGNTSDGELLKELVFKILH